MNENSIPYLSTSEVSERLRLTEEQVRALCRTGELKGAEQLREGGPWMIPQAAVDDWLLRHRARKDIVTKLKAWWLWLKDHPQFSVLVAVVTLLFAVLSSIADVTDILSFFGVGVPPPTPIILDNMPHPLMKVTWDSLDGPPPPITSISIDPNNAKTVLAGSIGALYESVDGGDSWDLIKDKYAYTSKSGVIYSIIFSTDSKALVATSGTRSPAINAGGDVLESITSLNEWQSHSFPKPILPPLQGVAVTQLEACTYRGQSYYFAITNGRGILRLMDIDEGVKSSWQFFNNGLTNLHTKSFACDSNSGVLYLGTIEGAYISHDMGAHWSLIMDERIMGSKVTEIKVDEETGYVYLAALHKDISSRWPELLLSKDRGDSWTSVYEIDLDGEVTAIAISPPTDTIYISVAGWLLKVNRKTLNYTFVQEAPWVNKAEEQMVLPIRDIAVDKTGQQVYLATDSGILKSSDGGSSWKFCNSGLRTSVVERLFVSPDKNSLIAARGNRLFRYSGGRWRDISYGFYVDKITALDGVTEHLFLGTISGRHGAILVSIDQGESWELLKEFYDDPIYTLLYIEENHTLIAGAKRGVYYSKDHGNSWNFISTIAYMTSLGYLKKDPGVIFAGSSQGFQYLFTNNLESEEILEIDLPNDYYRKVVVNSVHTIADLFYLCAEDGIYVLGKVGDFRRWMFQGKVCNDILILDEDTLIVASGNNLSMTENQGQSWADITTKKLLDKNVRISGLVVLNGQYFVGTQGEGVFVSKFGIF